MFDSSLITEATPEGTKVRDRLMCGIAGYLSVAAQTSSDELHHHARAMADVLQHRGPDDCGTWCDQTVGIALAHRRLSILDLSEAGHQPMHSAEGRLVVSFNGEIYNHMAIRSDLKAEGKAPSWRGHSDTETLLAAVTGWGLEASLQRLRGMFAFAIWDRQLRSLYLCRDRMGEKPLYYGWSGNTFLFGSELKALRTHPAWRGVLDSQAITLFMRFGYVPAPLSIYSGVSKLCPGCFVTLRLGARDLEMAAYSSARTVSDAAAHAIQENPYAAVDRLEALLRQAVGEQMIADVPVGAFLSGGVDSATVVALMQAESLNPVRTFTIGFQEEGYNEAIHAKAIARHLKTDHTELYVSSRDAMQVIPRLPFLFDEPFADSSQIPTYLIAQLARNDVTVALSGDGGDELFGGYDRYATGVTWFERLSAIPTPLRAFIAALLSMPAEGHWNALLRNLDGIIPKKWRRDHPGEKIRNLARYLRSPEGIYRHILSRWDKPEDLVIGGHESFAWPVRHLGLPIMDYLDYMTSADLMAYLPDDILVKVDRAAMGVGLETRIPLLDCRVVEFASSLPRSYKWRNGQKKWPLRQVLYRHVPSELVDRPKQGFSVPLGQWLRGPLRDWAEDLLDARRVCKEGLLQPTIVQQKWRQHLAGAAGENQLWSLLMFQSWLQTVENVTLKSEDHGHLQPSAIPIEAIGRS